MQTIVVEINNPLAFKLLHELEALKVLKIVKEDAPKKKIKLSEKYKNSFSKKDAQSFNKHTKKMREEWNDI